MGKEERKEERELRAWLIGWLIAFMVSWMSWALCCAVLGCVLLPFAGFGRADAGRGWEGRGWAEGRGRVQIKLEEGICCIEEC